MLSAVVVSLLLAGVEQDDPCHVPFDAEGVLKPACRQSLKPPTPAAPPEPEPEAFGRPVGMLGVMGAAIVAGGVVAPAFAFTGAVGVRFKPGVGVVAVAHGAVTGTETASVQIYGFGGGLRFGNRTQITIGGSATYFAATSGADSVEAVAPSAFVQAGITVGRHFTFVILPVVTFLPRGIFVSVAGGIGVTF